MKRTSISVLITYHDERGLLTECLDSLLAGGEGPDEILIYDDASSFPAADYVRTEHRVRILRQGDCRGPGFGRNLLAGEAASEFIHFHDADDLFARDWLEKVRTALSEESVSLIISEVVSFHSRDAARRLNPAVLDLEGNLRGEDLLSFCIQKNLLVPSVTLKRSFFLEVGGFNTHLDRAEDFDWFLRMSVRKPNFRVLVEPLVVIRIRDVSRSSNKILELTTGAEILRNLRSKIPESHHFLCSFRILSFAREVFDLGDADTARTIMQDALIYGRPHFKKFNLRFRWACQTLGFQNALRAGRFYRGVKSLWTRLFGTT